MLVVFWLSNLYWRLSSLANSCNETYLRDFVYELIKINKNSIANDRANEAHTNAAGDSPPPCLLCWKAQRITVAEWQWVRNLAWAANENRHLQNLSLDSFWRFLLALDGCGYGLHSSVLMVFWLAKIYKRVIHYFSFRDTVQWLGSCSNQFDAFTFISSCLYFNQIHLKHIATPYWQHNITYLVNRYCCLLVKYYCFGTSWGTCKYCNSTKLHTNGVHDMS